MGVITEGSVHRINYGGMTAWRMKTNVLKGVANGITEAIVLDKGFNIVSEKALIYGKQRELLRTEPERTIKAFLDADPNNYFTKGNAALLPANRIWGEVQGKSLRISWDGRECFVPMNFPNEKTSIHGLIFNRLYYDIHFDRTEHGITLSGMTEIPGNEWFSSLTIGHNIELLFSGEIRRSIYVYNNGCYSAPVSVGEHPYIDIPEGQDRAGVRLEIPAQSVVRADFSDNLRPMFKHPDLFAKFGGDFFPHKSSLNLEDIFLDNCFTNLIKPIVLKIEFPALKWGVALEGRQSVNAIQVYSPMDPAAAAFNSVAGELQGNYADPLNPEWKKHSDFGPMGFEGSGVKDLKSRESMIWEVIHRVYTMMDLPAPE